MITNNELIKMNKIEIETLLNSWLNDFKSTSTDQSEIKNKMFNHIKTNFSDIRCEQIDYHGNQFYIILNNRITINFKVSVKSTNEIVALSKLKNAYIKGKGKIKVDRIYHGLNHLCYEFLDEKKWEIKIDESCTMSGDPSSVELTDFNTPLCDMLEIDFLLKVIDKEYNKSLSEELIISVAQPVMKKLFFSLPFGEYFKKSDLHYFPEPYFSQLPDKINGDDLTKMLFKTVAEINADLIEYVIYNKTFNYSVD